MMYFDGNTSYRVNMRKPRARDLGIDLPGTPGRYNAITDVEGIEVGYSTIIKGTFEDYKGPESDYARTGVTAILPRGKARSAVFAGRHALNGNGEMTGTHWIDDSGFLHGPFMITNTNSVGTVRDATTKWMLRNKYYYTMTIEGEPVWGLGYFYPAVGETFDGMLNDIEGFHVKEEHVMEALNSARTGEPAEGNVGGGTGMQCHEFKGGTGTSSRVLCEEDGGYTVGVLVQANHGTRNLFEVLGVPLGTGIKGCDSIMDFSAMKPGTGSIIVCVATDAPVLPWQLTKMCKRVPIGIGKLGSGYESCSGDIFLAFSTANRDAYTETESTITLLGDDKVDPIYKAVAEAVEEAILNALCAAEDMFSKEGRLCHAIDTDQLVDILDQHGKIKKPSGGHSGQGRR